MHALSFAALLRDPSRGDRDSFLERYHDAALVIQEVADRPPSELDGRTPFVLPNWWRPTPVKPAGATAAFPLHRYGSVVWIEKSRRNPFANLITLGRAPNNDIRYPLEALSKLHATFAVSSERWHVQDHSSRNGTFLNDAPLEGGRLYPLADGDELRFGTELKTRFFLPAGLFDFIQIVARMTRAGG
jgi:hypothetical protein